VAVSCSYPYVGLEQLFHVRTHTEIQRVLTSVKVKAEEREAMAMLIKNGAGAARPKELRVAGKGGYCTIASSWATESSTPSERHSTR
jgi:hypothetical protein